MLELCIDQASALIYMCCAEHRVGLLLIQYVDKSYYGCYLCSRLMFQKLVKMIVDNMICEYHPKMLVVT